MSSSPANTTSHPLPEPPTAVPLALPPPLPIPPPSTRRLPPPCWSPDETLALINAYRDKWYSLGRGNLKATHWQDVADAVAQRCPNASPSKTPIQCRHKMEKLRKRYRTEIQRTRFKLLKPSWLFFNLMDSMEKGTSPLKSENNDSDSDDEDEDENQDQDRYLDMKTSHGSNSRSINKMYNNDFYSGGGSGSGGGVGVGVSGGFRVRFPAAQPESKYSSEQKYNPNLNYNYGMPPPLVSAPKVVGNERERDSLGEVVSAIKALGDGFVRMEQMKMDMAREIERRRMEMEMKRTEMILESQRRIVAAFAKAISDDGNDNMKRISSPQQP